ncbi:ROK family transcriptional regulator [Actinophytocola gossypii]|uniref:ROK family transcriptional regulator n=1 Tax=Actinophytocola gossypii TaxID=2812003 RepID=A0ABT2J8N3_9PSEU|nr:ROK family transcriptional regulator [Actinophytocola gossypii]MCT2584225.1 ROK family transcriptional regulator [Actinophytocola gossypii]
MDSKRATVRDLRRRNRSTLLSTLFFDGPLSRFELGQRTGLSAATVSTVVAEMAEDRLVVEAGLVESDGGRPRVLLRVNPTYAHVVGVDVGETGVTMELFDLALTRLAAHTRPLPPPRPAPALVGPLIAAGLTELLDQAGVPESSLLGIGIGVPGTVEQGATVRVHAQAIGWDAIAVAELLGDSGVTAPLFVENGAKTQGQAEMWFGAGRGARHAVIALIGSGVGATVITDGTTYRGSTSSAGEWGHTSLIYGGRACRCGAFGCLEAYVGAEGILDRYRKARGGRAIPRPDEQSQLDFLLTAADRSAPAAAIIEETVGYLGAGIANLINLFNPERIVLGGWAGLALGTRLLPDIRRATADHALRHAYDRTSIDLCRLGPDAVAVGAATLPVEALLTSGTDPRTRSRLQDAQQNA